ncbi:MAG: hypothetical protein ACK5Q5_04080 [Planctomycetaceae bacterium]
METITHQVRDLRDPEKTAAERLVGHGLRENQTLIIQVVNIELKTNGDDRPSQTLDDWTGVYAGLDEQQIEAVDEIAKTRADMSRFLPPPYVKRSWIRTFSRNC